PPANPGNDLPRNCASLFSEFRAGNFLVSIASHENNFVAHSYTVDVGYVDHHQIHCYSTKECAALSAYQHGGATVRKLPWIAISVTSRQSCDPHFARSDEGAAIADGAPFRQIAHEANARLPCHYWLEQFLKLRQRRNAVKHDAGAHNVEGLRIVRSCACALHDVRLVGSRKFSANLPNYVSESDELVARVFHIF